MDIANKLLSANDPILRIFGLPVKLNNANLRPILNFVQLFLQIPGHRSSVVIHLIMLITQQHIRCQVDRAARVFDWRHLLLIQVFD